MARAHVEALTELTIADLYSMVETRALGGAELVNNQHRP